MRVFAIRNLAAAAVFAAMAFAPPAPGAPGSPAAGNAAWQSIQTLQGEWDGLYEGKVRTKASYRLVSNGTALMESLESPDHSDMVTMYHPDGTRLLMTHYCSEANQSRMRAAGSDPKRIAFSFVDVTNLSSPDAMRMTGLVLTLKDKDHFTAEWTATGMGKSTSSVFEFTRKK